MKLKTLNLILGLVLLAGTAAAATTPTPTPTPTPAPDQVMDITITGPTSMTVHFQPRYRGLTYMSAAQLLKLAGVAPVVPITISCTNGGFSAIKLASGAKSVAIIPGDTLTVTVKNLSTIVAVDLDGNDVTLTITWSLPA